MAQPPQAAPPPLFAGGIGLAGTLWDSFVGRFNTAISRVREEFTEETFSLPRVIVVGAESHGKSSLLESIVRADVFPQNYVRCTRAPIHFTLRGVQQASEAAITVNNELLQSRAQIRARVKQLMDAIPVDNISDTPIEILIRDVELPTLDFVDLPGLCTNPPALQQQSHALVEKYLRTEDTMVLCVLQAPEPRMANSAAIAVIQEAGKLQDTILALTMADNVPAGRRDEFIIKRVLREADDMCGLQFAGVVAVKTRDTADEKPETLEQAQANEVTFFRDKVIANLLPERRTLQETIERSLTVPELIREMEVLFKHKVCDTWRPRALATMTTALERKQLEIAALGTPPGELDPQHVWKTAIGQVDLTALCDAMCEQEIPVTVTINAGQVIHTNMCSVVPSLPVAENRLQCGSLCRSLATAVQDTVAQVLAGTYHRPLIQAAYSAAFDDSQPLRLQRFQAVREQLLETVQAALAAVMRDCEDDMINMVDRHLHFAHLSMWGMQPLADDVVFSLQEPINVAIVRYLEPHFSPAFLQVPVDMNLVEKRQYAANRARLNRQVDEFQKVIEIINETIGEE